MKFRGPSPVPELHSLVRRGDLEGVRTILRTQQGRTDFDIDAYDRKGLTPLMYAVQCPAAPVEMVRLLLEQGGQIDRETRQPAGLREDVLVLCLMAGDPQKAAVLMEHGANIHYRGPEGYNALIHAVHGRDVLHDPRLMELLELLVSKGVSLNGVTRYRETALRVLSRIGRFDAVRYLLSAGADASELRWTPLHQAVAMGSFADVKNLVEGGANLEERDWWSRTPWLLAVQTGDVAKAGLLYEHGADANARGRGEKPSLFYAIENHQGVMLQRLIDMGVSVEQTDEYGATPLEIAVESRNAEAVSLLVRAGADVNREKGGFSALTSAVTRDVAVLLLNAGADPGRLSSDGRRALLGLDVLDPDDVLPGVSVEEYRTGRSRRFGATNPEKIVEPLCEAMIRAGVSAYEASKFFEGHADAPTSPVWCAQRFGQSITFLPDGRIVQVGGEHEDAYDQDFCIYNDVFVHGPDGTIDIYGYPEADFPPTDFHAATLIGNVIYIIGSLGYQGTRKYGVTPVYRLDTGNFRMEAVQAKGQAPGWIYRHRAIQASPHEIRIAGGDIVTHNGSGEIHSHNQRSYVLDVNRCVWRAEPVP